MRKRVCGAVLPMESKEMTEKYVQEVKRTLSVSRVKKQEIMRDLREMFSSAEEHGESAGQVIERLGTPKELARNIEQQMGFDRAGHRRRRLVLIFCLAAIAVILFLLYFAVKTARLPDNVIGYADSMTGIQLRNDLAFDITSLTAAGGIAVVAAAVLLLVSYIRKR